MRWSPRYKGCLYVEKGVMDGASVQEIGFFAGPYCPVMGRGVLIDGQFGEHDQGFGTGIPELARFAS